MRRNCLVLISVALVLWSAMPRAAAQPPSADPVAALRWQLSQGRQSGDDSAIAAKHREEALAKTIAVLQTLSQLRQALALAEWRDNDVNVPRLAAVDAAARAALADRLVKELEKTIKGGDETSRLAACLLLGSLGTVRAVNVKDSHGLGRSMVPLVLQLCDDKAPVIRVAAAAALGKMNPEAKAASAAFTKLLNEPDGKCRVAAAGGLLAYVTNTALLQKKGRMQTGVEANRQDVLAAAEAVVAAAGAGATDADPAVRRLCLETFKAAVTALAELIPDPLAEGTAPPAGRLLSDFEMRRLQQELTMVDTIRKLMQPTIDALKKHSMLVQGCLLDGDETVAQAAAGVIEMLAVAQRRMRAYVGSVPLVDLNGGTKPAVLPNDFGVELKASVPLLAKKLDHPSIETKLAVLYTLETLERDAVSAAPVVVRALEHSDPFVRWGAARTLGRMADVKGPHVAGAVAALAKHLSDDNVRVRTTAAVALKLYGPAAKGAVTDLATAVTKGDAEMRQFAMLALAAIGPEAQGAVPALVQALTAKEIPVRLAAARTLEQLGPGAAAALPALRRALADADEEVSLAAADAVLAIQRP